MKLLFCKNFKFSVKITGVVLSSCLKTRKEKLEEGLRTDMFFLFSG